MKAKVNFTGMVENTFFRAGEEVELTQSQVNALGSDVEVLEKPKEKEFKPQNTSLTKKQVKTK